MNLRVLTALVVMITAIFACGCFGEEKVVTTDMRGGKSIGQEGDSAQSSAKDDASNDGTKITAGSPDSIEKALQSMTLAEKVGQMVMFGFEGTELNNDVIFSLNNFHFGGVILFDRNLLNADQTRKLVDDITATAKQKVPLFFAIDEEGGLISRGQDFLEAAPSQEEIGLSGDVSAATRWAKHNAKILRDIGVNLNFAPVADVGSRDTRSFGDAPQTVVAFVEAAAQGYEAENFLYTLKHFPGIGKSKIDPHQEVSVIDIDRATLDAEDLPPFVEIIRKHDNSRFMVMVGHLKYTALDPANSASLSPAVMTELLRKELGYSGVIITDDLEMGAIKNNVDLATLGVKMILAGGDIALVCHSYASQQVVYNSILEAVKRGEISEARIDESVRRILQMKAHL